MSDAGLDQVAGAVQLMEVAQVREALVRAVELAPGVQVAVGPLCAARESDDLVHGRPEGGFG